MSRIFNKNKFLLSFVLLLSLVTIVGCSSDESKETIKNSSELRVGLSTANLNERLKLDPSKVILTLTNQNDMNEQMEKSSDYNQGDVAFSFKDLKKDVTYNIDVIVKDDAGYEIYQGSDRAVINSDSQSKEVRLNQTKAKGLVVDFKNIPGNAASGEIRLIPAQDTLESSIDLNAAQAEFNELIASNYAVEVELFDADGSSIYKEQTKPNLSVLPGRVTEIKVDLSSETKLIVDVDWSSAAAPEAPSGLTAEGTAEGIKLNWDDNAEEYMVYRGKDAISRLPLEEIQSNSYNDWQAVAGTTYYYWVRAIGKDGLNSDLAGPVEATAAPSLYDGVKVHFKDTGGTPNIYAWQVKNDELVELTGEWPGSKMTAEGDGWYQTAFPALNEVNMVFIPSTGEKTADLKRSKNEWWYQDGQWYSTNPDDKQSPKPVVSIAPSGGEYKGSQEIEITVTANNLTELNADFNGQSVPLNDTENKVDKTTIELGDYLADGEEAALRVTAANEQGSTTKRATYNRNDSQEADFTFHFKYGGSDTPYIYTWLDLREPTGKWPGAKMTDEGNGYYVYRLTNTELKQLKLIFNWNGGDAQTDNLSVSSQGEYWYEDIDGDGEKELYQKGKPDISIYPTGGTYSGDTTVNIKLKPMGAEISSAKYEINGQEVPIDGLEDSFKLSDYLADGAEGNLTVTAVNKYGETTTTRSYKRDDEKIVETEFTWDNANIYFVITDRFYNGDTSNDNSYGRPQVDATGEEVGTFHGGDIPGLTEKIEDGYFNRLGVNAIWVTAPYEQMHGFVGGGAGDFAHYAYHGYYPLDYTEMDKNMGTIKQFREFVNTAHEHDIRIVMDIVMNHPGYNTIQDMNQYGFGAWKGEQLDKDWSPGPGENWHTYNDNYIDQEHGADKWDNWWGPDWMRADLAGYDPPGNTEETRSVSYLPDFKTESEAAVEIPEFLDEKWRQEGSSNDQWVVPAAQDLREDLGIAPADYITKWLAAWVREFGIDAFRVDTAKHVGTKQWGELKQVSQNALEDWRASNSDKAASDWDEDFWMVGELYDYNVDMGESGDYFDDNDGDGRRDFDALINFGFPKNGNLSAIGGDWSDYAKKINTKDEFTTLSYISSHDKGIGAQDNKIDAGTALLLAPGAVQIYYGDEIDREPDYRDCSDDGQPARSDYDWNHSNHHVLEHWQKLGQFRNNHPAVGAGMQEDLGSNTYLRTYKNDKVVIRINAEGTTTVNVGSAFADGTTLRNAYTGNEATVTDGTVQFEAGDHGVILIEKAK